MSKDFIIKRDIRISRVNNEEKTKHLYTILKKQEIRDKHNLRDSR